MSEICFTFCLFHHIPSELELYLQLVFGSIAFLLFWWSRMVLASTRSHEQLLEIDRTYNISAPFRCHPSANLDHHSIILQARCNVDSCTCNFYLRMFSFFRDLLVVKMHWNLTYQREDIYFPLKLPTCMFLISNESN